jgi:predicted ATPase
MLLTELLSIPVSDGCPPVDLTPQRKKEKIFETLLRQLDGLARQRPVLVIYEDVHWIDPTSCELLDLMARRVRRLPVLILITFRPEFQPRWTGQPHVTAMMLSPLGERDGAALVNHIVGDKARLPADVVEEIIERTDGVPLSRSGRCGKAWPPTGRPAPPTGRRTCSASSQTHTEMQERSAPPWKRSARRLNG